MILDLPCGHEGLREYKYGFHDVERGLLKEIITTETQRAQKTKIVNKDSVLIPQGIDAIQWLVGSI